MENLNFDWKKKQDSQRALDLLKNSQITVQELIDLVVKSSTFWLFLGDHEFFHLLNEHSLLKDEHFSELFKRLESPADLNNFNMLYASARKLNVDSETGNVKDSFLAIFKELLNHQILTFDEALNKIATIRTKGDDVRTNASGSSSQIEMLHLLREMLDFKFFHHSEENCKSVRALLESFSFEDFSTFSYWQGRPLSWIIDNGVLSFKEVADICNNAINSRVLISYRESALRFLDFDKYLDESNLVHILNTIRWPNDLGYVLVPQLDNVYKCIENSSLSIEHIIEICKNARQNVVDGGGCVRPDPIGVLLYNTKLLSDNSEILRALFDSIDTSEAIDTFYENSEMSRFFIEQKLITFKEYIDKYLEYQNTAAYKMIVAHEDFKHFVENKLITNDDLKYAIDAFKDHGHGRCLSYISLDPFLLCHILRENLISFQSLVDVLAEVDEYFAYHHLRGILRNEEGFKVALKEKLITDEDIQYLFGRIESSDELQVLNRYSRFLIQYCAENFLLTTGLLNKLDKITPSLNPILDHFIAVCKHQQENTDNIEIVQNICKLNGTDKEKDELFSFLHNSLDARKALQDIRQIDQSFNSIHSVLELKETIDSMILKKTLKSSTQR